MIDAETLAAMIAEDELGLLNLAAKPRAATTDERMAASFNEITEFVRAQGREPAAGSADMSELKLHARLQALRDNDEAREALADRDDLSLLAEAEAPRSVADAAADDSLGLLDGDDEDILTLRHVPKPQTMPETIARREPAADFEDFRQMFADCHADLRSGRRKLIAFKNPLDIKPGRFFVQSGVLLHVSDVGDLRANEIGKSNARTRCIFENGTESRLLLQSLASNLYKGGKRVTEPDAETLDAVAERLRLAADTEMATIYVLRSLSEDAQLRKLTDLHKIGSTSTTVAERVAGAASETTFLGAPVQSVAEYQVPRGMEGKVERLLHRLFSSARVDAWFERDGRTTAETREWFEVPLSAINEAIDLISNGTIVDYEYDVSTRTLRLRR